MFVRFVVGHPQYQMVFVNVSEMVRLNCTASFLEYPVYNWSIPDTCSSCPHTNNDNNMTFPADVNDSGEYICTAGNDYERALKTFAVSVIGKQNFCNVMFENNVYYLV